MKTNVLTRCQFAVARINVGGQWKDDERKKEGSLISSAFKTTLKINVSKLEA